MILASRISKVYEDGGTPVHAVHEVALHLEKGDFAIITGRSGAGKSTLLAVLGGLLRPSKGEVILEERSLWEMDERERARLRAEKIGFVLQKAPLVGALNAIENVLLPAAFSGGGDRDMERAGRLLDRVGLGHKMRSYPGQLSGGEKRRVAVASALMNDPPLILADEITGDLDAETQLQIMSLFAELHERGKTIVMVTHRLELADYADRYFRMESGTLSELTKPSGWAGVPNELECDGGDLSVTEEVQTP